MSAARFPQQRSLVELAPGEPEGFVAHQLVAFGVVDPERVFQANGEPFELGGAFVEGSPCLPNREGDRGPVGLYDPDDLLLSGQPGIDVADGKDRAGLVAAL